MTRTESAGGVGGATHHPPTQQGYALIALIAAITIMMIAMAAAIPSWRYVMKNDREEELLFRGEQIANAIVIHQGKHGLPTKFEQLVERKCLRKAYKDPMTADGKWRLLVPGAGLAVGVPRSSASPRPSPSPGLGGGEVTGPFNGVASRSTEKSLRKFISPAGTGETYDKWYFVAGNMPPTIGRPLGPTLGPGRLPGQNPSPAPSGQKPSPAPSSSPQ